MTVALNFTDAEAEEIITTCKALVGNPALWLLSARLERVLSEERDRQAEATRVEAYNAARAAWQHHVSVQRCQACNRALANGGGPTLITKDVCDAGRIAYTNLLDAMASVR